MITVEAAAYDEYINTSKGNIQKRKGKNTDGKGSTKNWRQGFPWSCQRKANSQPMFDDSGHSGFPVAVAVNSKNRLHETKPLCLCTSVFVS